MYFSITIYNFNSNYYTEKRISKIFITLENSPRPGPAPSSQPFLARHPVADSHGSSQWTSPQSLEQLTTPPV